MSAHSYQSYHSTPVGVQPAYVRDAQGRISVQHVPVYAHPSSTPAMYPPQHFGGGAPGPMMNSQGFITNDVNQATNRASNFIGQPMTLHASSTMRSETSLLSADS